MYKTYFNYIFNYHQDKVKIRRTNEQGIISLYFTIIKPQWQQITLKNDDTYFYDS